MLSMLKFLGKVWGTLKNENFNISREMLKMLKMLKFLGKVWGTQKNQTLTFPHF